MMSNYLNRIVKKVISVYDRQFDYWYLKSKLNSTIDKKRQIETLFLGSSYTIFGINSKSNELNIGLPAQDLYYSVKLALQLLHLDVVSKRIVLGLGYYTLGCDLSKSSSMDNLYRIVDVYYPILLDSHNMSKETFDALEKKNNIIYISVRTLVNAYFRVVRVGRYFNDFTHTRQRRAIRIWNENKLNWDEIDDEERIKCAKIRCISHSRQLSYKDSIVENLKLLESLWYCCQKKGIDLGVFVAPMSAHYLHEMNPEYTAEAAKAVQIIKKFADVFVDYNYNSEFVVTDFVDPDHLSDIGANKLTRLVRKDFGIDT